MKKLQHAALVLLACAGAAHAQTDLYISEYKFNDAQMSAVRTDGTNPRTLFGLPAAYWLPLGLDFDVSTGRLLWMDSAGASEIMSANLDGSGLSIVTGVPGFARTTTRDASGRIFFSTGHQIMRVNADGSGLTTVFTGEDSNFTAGNPIVDATNGHFYVGYLGEILRFDLNGFNRKTITSAGSSIRAIGLDVANRTLYWIDADPHTDFVARVNLDGSDFRVIYDVTPNSNQSSGLIELLVDGANEAVYFADEFTGQVIRTDLDGESPTVVFTSASGRAPSGLALSTGAPVQALNDCNGNGIADDIDISNGEPDCDNNGVPDSCQADACPDWTVLVDQGSNAPNSSGRALGVPSRWEVFQPFDVPPGGWSIGQIGLDGYTVQFVNGGGFTLTIYPDNGAGTRPDESQPLAESGEVHFYYNTNRENWTYAPLNVQVPAGRHWLQIKAIDPDVYWGSVNLGLSGPQSLSRGASGNFSSPAPPIALRIIEAEVCLANYNGDGEVDILDFLDFFEDFGGCENQPAPCGTLYNADVNGDTIVDIVDFLDFLDAFGQGC